MSLFLLGSGCGKPSLSCEAVEGSVTGHSTPILNSDGAVTGFRVVQATVGGQLSGTSDASFTIARMDDDGTLYLTGSHTFWDGGQQFLFRTRDEGLTTAAGQIENTLTIIEGATGSLATEGHVDLQTGTLVLDYSGEVCR